MLVGRVAKAVKGKVGPRVLVVDDEPDILAAVRTILEAMLSARVLVAPSGAKALELLRWNPVDVIVTDFKMPGMNGIEFLREARRIVPRAPIILITAFERELVNAAQGESAADAVLLKPLSPQPLVQTVQRALGSVAL